MKHKDERAKLTNAILSDIKVIKLYGWEKTFMEKVLGIRKQELQALKKSQILFSASLASFHSSTFLIAFVMFAVYTLVDTSHVLDAQKAFVSLTLINILNTAHSFLPFSINAAVQFCFSERLRTLAKQSPRTILKSFEANHEDR
ncbi:PREDICTED: multidrug resistance-associated protein 6-like [Calidris pugnax]|uniref:multidrug resistance-associated protein 6-like n=1 Tax=Calidris pugnax TaxID=198806 RepID=UPI00071D5945|nr:PREDICTED: multidrug resistance-associated protein 6-like [Calidris pugnax]